jgi:hypothetical protein
VTAAADAAGAAVLAERGSPATVAPLLDLRRYSLPIVPIRLLLGLLFLGASRVAGLEPGPSARLFGLGVFLFALAMLTSRRRRLFWVRAREATPIDARAPIADWPWTIARSTFPSTLAVTALAALALPLNSALTALLGGVLAGMGVVSGVFAVELLNWERGRGVRLMSTPGLNTELYVRPAGGATEAAPPTRAS